MGLLLPLASQIVYQVGCKLGRGPDPGGCRGAAVQSWPFWSGVSGVCWAPRLPDSARFSGISLWTKLLTYIIVKQGVYWTGKPRMLDFAIPWSWKCWVNEMFFLNMQRNPRVGVSFITHFLWNVLEFGPEVFTVLWPRQILAQIFIGALVELESSPSRLADLISWVDLGKACLPWLIP